MLASPCIDIYSVITATIRHCTSPKQLYIYLLVLSQANLIRSPIGMSQVLWLVYIALRDRIFLGYVLDLCF